MDVSSSNTSMNTSSVSSASHIAAPSPGAQPDQGATIRALAAAQGDGELATEYAILREWAVRHDKLSQEQTGRLRLAEQQAAHLSGLVQTAQHQAAVNLSSAKHYEETMMNLHNAGKIEQQKVNHEAHLLQKAQIEIHAKNTEVNLLGTQLHNVGQVAEHEQIVAQKLSANLVRSVETTHRVEEQAEQHLNAYAIRDSEYKQAQSLSVQQVQHIVQHTKIESQQQEQRIQSMRDEYQQAMAQCSVDMDSSRKYMENIESEQRVAWETYSQKLATTEVSEKGKASQYETMCQSLREECNYANEVFGKMQHAGASLHADNINLKAALQQSAGCSDKLEEGHMNLQRLRVKDQEEFAEYRETTEARISELQLSTVLTQVASTPLPNGSPESPEISRARSVDSAQNDDIKCVREELKKFDEHLRQIKEAMKLQAEHIEALKGDVLDLQEKTDESSKQGTPQAPPAEKSPDVLPHFVIHGQNVSTKVEQPVITGLPEFVKSDIAATGAVAAGSGIAATRAEADPIPSGTAADLSMTRFDKAITVTVPSFPKINGLDAWKTAVCRGLASAAGQFDQAEVAWFAEVYTKSFEELGASVSARRFGILEQPLAMALLKTVPDQLRTRMNRLEATAIKEGKLITGRQVAWKILEWFKTDAYQNTYSTMSDLSNLGWRGDSAAQMEHFLVDWDYMLEHLPQVLGDESMRDMFLPSGSIPKF